jgi:flagellar motility protein MotE (MotC chaperone)
MVRAAFLLGVMLVSFLTATFRAQAQEVADQLTSGPLESRPAARKSVAQPPRKVAKPKPQKKPAAVAQQQPGPQFVERPAAAPIPATRAPVTAEKPSDKCAVTEPVRQAPEPRPPFDEYVITQFCTSLSSAASDGRLAWQAKRLDEMEVRLRDRVAELEAKRAETAEWLKRREDAQRKADESVVAIYAKMKPDAAAAQFSAMDESGAAAILAKLNPRAASTILNEIDASRAARIAAEMAGVGPRREAARAAP